jgi:hypothetical protein
MNIFLLFFLLIIVSCLCYSPRYLPITIIGNKNLDISNNNNYENLENNIKILNLVLYSKGNDEYDYMKRITEEYYKNFTNVKTVYYAFSESITTPYKLEKNVLLIKGTESYVPGIIEKTKKTFLYFKDDYNKYDYVVRSNISTIINFQLLSKELSKNPIDYGSGMTFSLQSFDVDNSNEKIYDVNFASGTSIIMSQKVIKNIINNVNNIRDDIIDDVSIGVFIKDYMPDIKMKQIVPDKYTFIPNYDGNYDKVYGHVKNKDFIFYRNRSDAERSIDATQMSQIVRIIS